MVLPLLLSSVIFLLSMTMAQTTDSEILYDFRTVTNIDIRNDWIESSDTVRRVGMSKATLTLQKTQLFQKGIFFALLNPQPNGAGFAGMKFVKQTLNLTTAESIQIKLRAQGQLNNYKFVLINDSNETSVVTFENFFNVTLGEQETITLKLDDFLPYYRGRPVADNPPQLNREKIISMGFQAYGGVYTDHKEQGVGSLEMEWIRILHPLKK